MISAKKHRPAKLGIGSISDRDDHWFRVTVQQANAIDPNTPQHFLVLPMPTLAAAKKRLRWEKLSEGKRELYAAKALWDSFQNHETPWASLSGTQIEYWKDRARSVLSLIQP